MRTLKNPGYMYTAGHSRLISTGVFLPEERITSREIMQQFDSKNRFNIPFDWLERTTGIRERRVAPRHLKPSDLAAKAATEALEQAGLRPNKIDAVLYAGVDRDHLEPATAHVVQHKIGAANAIAFDISNACLGFMNAMHVMDSLIATGQVRRGLVVTGEKGHPYTQKAVRCLTETTDRNSFGSLWAGLTLGDAGAAAIMAPKLGPDTGFMGFAVQSKAEFHELCVCGNSGDDSPLTTNVSKIVKETTKLVGPMYEALMCNHLKWKPEQLNRYIPHQVGLRSVRKHAEVAGVPVDKVPVSVDSLGNIVSATIPVNLQLLSRDHKLQNGAKIYLSGTGSGICLSQAGLVWDAA
ncbi:MAG: ketoacyl-ACP synthase III [Gammaproteobacteria bacterium]|nr:ketoacyl-ACP synthase III [Gammaproteobacteria bacterium]